MKTRVLAAGFVAAGLIGAGCTSPVGSAATKGAVYGGAAGATVGLLSSSSGPLVPTAIGVGAGAATGAIVGMIAKARDEKEQTQMAAERLASVQEMERKKVEAAEKAKVEDELAIANGMQITDLELEVAKRRLAEKQAELESYKAELDQARARSKLLTDSNRNAAQADAEIAELKAMLEKLKPATTPKDNE